MSEVELATDPLVSLDAAIDHAEAIRALAAENIATVARLRGTQIPQHVGMAGACRALAVELPAMLVAQLEEELRSGLLATRWAEVRAAAAVAPADGVEGTASSVAAIAVLLREQTRAVMRHLVARGKEWTADAYRLEGQAAALEAQVERLAQLVNPAPHADAAAPVTGATGGSAEAAG